MNFKNSNESPLIDLRSRLQHPVNRRLYDLARPLVEKSFAIGKFNHDYADAANRFHGRQAPSLREWFKACLDSFGLEYESDRAMLDRIPESGPLVVVANHPFGFADAVIIGHLISQVRPDAKFLANSMLQKIPEVQPWIIPVDNFDGDGSERRNLGPMRMAIRHLSSGGSLIVFPAGEVAHFHVGRGVEECEWSEHVGSLIRLTKANVLPVNFAGRNSILFQMAGLLHPRVRTSLLLRELCAKRGRIVRIRVGETLPFSKLKRLEGHKELTRHLRLVTLALGHQAKATEAGPETVTPVSSEPNGLLAEEIAGLRERGLWLASQGSLSVYVGGAHEIPRCLREIGRLREKTFQAIGEGTGDDVDLDGFDEHYMHLILWDEAQGKIAGGYRMGQADVLMKARGSKGLYTHTLFRFSRRFLAKLDCAVELGRSFVCQEYQRHPAALMLLWKGISAWILRNPRYKLLFGPVSISQEYDEISRRLMVDFLTATRQPAELRSMVRARTPFRSRRAGALHRELAKYLPGNAEELSTLVSTIEQDHKGLPVLLRHYLKLNASVLCFNVDHDFSSVVDGLILVDLTKTDPRVLARYMGEDGVQTYFNYHGVPSDDSAVKCSS